MNPATEKNTTLLREIQRALDEIHDPCSVSQSMPMGLGEMGLLKSIDVTPSGHVEITLRLTSPFCEMVPFMQGEAVRRVGAIAGVAGVEVRHDGGLDWNDDMIAPDAQRRRRRRLDAIRRLTEQRLREAKGDGDGDGDG